MGRVSRRGAAGLTVGVFPHVVRLLPRPAPITTAVAVARR